jgi:membrane protein involved in colicin uptake
MDTVTGKPKKNAEREALTALTPEEKAAQKAERAAEKEAKRAAKKSGGDKKKGGDGDDDDADAAAAADNVADVMGKLKTGGGSSAALDRILSGQELLAQQRAVTGVLASNPTSKDYIKAGAYTRPLFNST